MLVSEAVARAYASTASFLFALVPPDPLKLATGVTQVPAMPATPGVLVALIPNAPGKYLLHAARGPAHVLRVSFNARGAA